MHSDIVPMLTYENALAAMVSLVPDTGRKIWKASDGCLCKRFDGKTGL